jgi:hypothetical protein
MEFNNALYVVGQTSIGWTTLIVQFWMPYVIWLERLSSQCSL